MKTVFENVIRKGDFALGELLKKIDTYHISGKLTDTDRDYLYSLARGTADPTSGADIYAKLAELDSRLRKVEAAQSGTESGDTTGEETPAEYVPGKWYYGGDRVTYSGKTYTCTAPEGVACVWSPDEYPAYWQEE